jgi:hypothetical protein
MHDMTRIVELPARDWDEQRPASNEAVQALEDGHILWLPHVRFELTAQERALMSLPVGNKAKNISFDPARSYVRGVEASEADLHLLQATMSRFGRSANALLAAVLPHYAGRLRQARVSYRPTEIAGRITSWR